ncbi:hypothetical protein HY837_01025 [archaeon]|nr:hypothetical protein [archaeon]
MELVDRLVEEGTNETYVISNPSISMGKKGSEHFICIPGRATYLHAIILHTLVLGFAKYNPFLPSPLRKLARDPGLLPERTLYLFHESITKRKLKREIKRAKKFSRINEEEFYANFINTYTDSASCIFPIHSLVNDYHLPIIIGRQETVQEAMNFLKESPENFLKLFSELTQKYKGVSHGGISGVQDAVKKENTDKIELYDSLAKPREVHFNL